MTHRRNVALEPSETPSRNPRFPFWPPSARGGGLDPSAPVTDTVTSCPSNEAPSRRPHQCEIRRPFKRPRRHVSQTSTTSTHALRRWLAFPHQ